MHRISIIIAGILSGCLSLQLALAASPGSQAVYDDMPNDLPTQIAAQRAIAIGALDQQKPFAPKQLITRGELVDMAMRAFAANKVLSVNGDGLLATVKYRPVFTQRDCFADVSPSDPLALSFCKAKHNKFVQGDVRGHQTFFYPNRPVTYAEALAILSRAFLIHMPDAGKNPWYVPYIDTTLALGVAERGIAPATAIDRATAVRLLAAFDAFSSGELKAYRAKQRGRTLRSSSSFSRSRVSSSSRSSSSVSSSLSSSVPSSVLHASSSSSPSAVLLDSYGDTTLRAPQQLLLGEVGPVIGAASVFLYEEPLAITSVSVNLNSPVTSMRAVLIFDQDGRALGRANFDPTASTNRTYTLHLPHGRVTVGQRERRLFYVRPDLSSKEFGGSSNEIVEIGNIVFEGEGVWSNQHYTKASTETFRAFATARAAITSIARVGLAQEVLTPGVQRDIGSFVFTARQTDGTAHVRITDLVFRIGQTGNVSLNNVRLRGDGSNTPFDCISNASTVTCASVPDTFGALEDGPRTLTLSADVTVPSTSPSGSLRLSLVNPGTIGSAGDISWTDGTTDFDWVGLPAPLADGTVYKY